MANINDELNKTEQNLKDTEKAVESLGDKIKELSDILPLADLSERIGIGSAISKAKEFEKIFNSLRNIKGEGTQKQLKQFEQMKKLSEEIKKDIQESFVAVPGYVYALQKTIGGSQEDAFKLLNSFGIDTDPIIKEMNKPLEEVQGNIEEVEYDAKEAAKAIRDLMSAQKVKPETEVETEVEIEVDPEFIVDNDYRDKLKKVIESYNFENDAQFFEAHRYLGFTMETDDDTEMPYSIDSFKQYLDSFIGQSEDEINKRFAEIKDHFGKEYTELIKDVFNGKEDAPLFSKGYRTLNSIIDSKLAYITNYYRYIENINEVEKILNNANNKGYSATAEDIKRAEENIGKIIPEIDISKKKIMELAEIMHNTKTNMYNGDIYDYRNWNDLNNMFVPVTDNDIEAAKNEINKIIEAYKNMTDSLDGKVSESFKEKLDGQLEQYKSTLEQLNNRQNLPNTRYGFYYTRGSNRDTNKNSYERSEPVIRQLQESIDKEIKWQENVIKQRKNILGKYEKVSSDEGLLEELSKLKTNNDIAEYIKNALIANIKGLINELPGGAGKILRVRDFSPKNPIREGKTDNDYYTTAKEKFNANSFKTLEMINKLSNDEATSIIKSYRLDEGSSLYFKEDAIDKIRAKSKEYGELIRNSIQQPVTQTNDVVKSTEEVKEQVNEVKDTINVLAEDANIAGAKISESFDDISSSADDTYDSIDELLGITREQSRDAIKGIEELDDSFGVLSDEVKNIGYVDLSDLEFASVDTDKLKELQDMNNLIQKKKEQLSLEQRIQGYNRYASSQRGNVLKEEESIRSYIQSENTKTSYYKQAQAEREKVLREEQSIRSKLEKQAQAEAEQTLKKTENKVKEVCSTIVNTIKKTISNIIGIIRKLNTLLNKSINLLINGFRGAFNTIRRIITLFGNFGNRIKTVSHNGNILKGTFTELKSKIDLLVGAFRGLFNNEFLQNGMKLLSSVQTLNMLIGKDLTAKTIDWANNLEKGFGLSASGLIQNLQAVSSVLYGMGMSSENVYNAGRNLEALGMTMSSITGLDFDTVISKIDSGMKGMTQSIDDLGLSVRESQMDAFLQKLKAQGGEYANIGTKFANLTEDQRVYVRYAAIMDQFMSKEAFSIESYARSLNTLTGQMSILKQQVQQLKSTIGLLAIKLFAQIVKPLTYIVYLANLAVKKIAALFGIDLETSNAINELGGSGIDTSGVDGLTDSLNETADAAEDAKGGLSALDHITSLNTSKSNSGAGADAFDYSKLANYNDNYADMLEELGKMNDDYIEQCRQALIQMLKDMEKRVGDWFKRLTGRVIDWDVVEKNFGRSWKNIKNTLTNLKTIFKNVFDIVGGLFGSVLDDLDFSTLFEKFTRLISYLTRLGAIITKRLQPYIQKFYDDYLSPYVVKFGDWLEEHLDKWIKKTEEWLGGWESHKYDNDIKNYFEKTLPEKFNKFVESIQNAKDKITEIKNFIKGGDTDKTFIDVIKEKYEFLRDNVLKPVKDILDDIKLKLFNKNGDKTVDLEDAKISLGDIRDKIKEVGDYLSEHKDEIVNLLVSAVTFIVELGKIKLTIFEELFKFLVDHADTIKAICDKVIELIDYAIAHPELSIALTIATGAAYGAINLIFEYFKQKFAAKILKKVLGLDDGGEIEKAGKSIVSKIFEKVNKETDGVLSKLKGPINAVANVSIVLVGVAALATAIASTFKMGWDQFTDGIRGFKINKGGLDQRKIKDEAYAAADAMRELGDTSDETKQKLIDNFAKNAYALASNEKAAEAAIEQYRRSLEDGLSNHPLTKLWIDLGDALHWNEQKASIERNKQFITGSYDEISNQVTGSLDEISLSADDNVSSLDSLIGTYDELNGASGAVVENNNNVKMSLDELVNANSAAAQSAQEHKDTVSELREQINKDLAEIGKVSESTKSRIDAYGRSIAADFVAIRLSVSNVTNTVNRLHQALMNLTSRQWKVNFRDGVSTSNVRWASDSGSRIGIKGFGYANGGVPKSGSLFFANENGNPELVGNFGGYTGVANQDMIIQAIKEAAVQNSNGTGTVINNNFNIGNMLGTDADFRKLVSKVTQVQRQQNYNIANGSFAMT